MSLPAGVSTSQAGSFAGIYWLYNQGGDPSVPRVGMEVEASTDSDPYSDTEITHIGGRRFRLPPLPIRVAAADWATLEGLVGQTATLQLAGDSTRQAVLLSLTEPRYYHVSGSGTSLDWRFATATFQVLT